MRPPCTSPGDAGACILLARATSLEQLASVGNQTGGRVFGFVETDDLARDHEAFVARGVTFVRPPSDEVYGRVAVFEDLYGNRFDLIEPARKRAGSSGESRRAMLDHLSLGVADLARAARFYDAVLAPLGFVRVWTYEEAVAAILVVMRDRDSLYANLPVGAASLEAKLDTKGELDADVTLVGATRSSAPRSAPTSSAAIATVPPMSSRR